MTLEMGRELATGTNVSAVLTSEPYSTTCLGKDLTGTDSEAECEIRVPVRVVVVEIFGFTLTLAVVRRGSGFGLSLHRK